MAENNEEPVTFQRRIFKEISENLAPSEWRIFGNKLELSHNAMLNLGGQANVHHYGLSYKINRMLEKWKKKKKPTEDRMVSLLKPILASIGREDIANNIQRIHDEEFNS